MANAAVLSTDQRGALGSLTNTMKAHECKENGVQTNRPKHLSGDNKGWSLQCYSLNASAAQLQQYLVRSGPAGSMRSAWAAVWYTVVTQTLDDTAELRRHRVITHRAPESVPQQAAR